jgi:hypothetical protein
MVEASTLDTGNSGIDAGNSGVDPGTICQSPPSNRADEYDETEIRKGA